MKTIRPSEALDAWARARKDREVVISWDCLDDCWDVELREGERQIWAIGHGSASAYKDDDVRVARNTDENEEPDATLDEVVTLALDMM